MGTDTLPHHELTHCAWCEEEPCTMSEGTWNSDCGLYWSLEESTPAENEMTYCPKCGKPIKAIPYQEPAP